MHWRRKDIPLSMKVASSTRQKDNIRCRWRKKKWQLCYIACAFSDTICLEASSSSRETTLPQAISKLRNVWPKVYPVVHVSRLKRYHGDKGDPNRSKSKRAPTIITNEFNKEIDCILADWVIRKQRVTRLQRIYYTMEMRRRKRVKLGTRRRVVPIWRYDLTLPRRRDEYLMKSSRRGC